MITIAHLYYDLMNLYGEHANIRALREHFKKQEVETEVVYLSKNDQINFYKYDIYYMGMGTEKNQQIVLEDLMKYHSDIKKSIKSKLFIITGNSLELFGQDLITSDNNKINTLGIFNYYTKNIPSRIVEEALMKTSLIEEPIIGFQNREGIINDIDNYWFDVINGTGSNNEIKKEGYHQNGFYGTYLIGPILIRNPYLTDYFVKLIMDKKQLKFKANNEGVEYQAYQANIDNAIKKAE